jgi:hypothetical protein
MAIEGCVHVDPDSGEVMCPACREMLRREREVGLQIIPAEEERRRHVPPPFTPEEISRIDRDDDVGDVGDGSRTVH